MLFEWLLFALFLGAVIAIDRFVTMTPFASRLFRFVAIAVVVLWLLKLAGVWGRLLAS